MQIGSIGANLHEMLNPVLSEKYQQLSPAELVQRALIVSVEGQVKEQLYPFIQT